jgi:outer membrane protein TolC
MERMVQLAMSNSFTIRRLNLEVERSRHSLRAERARLKSSVELDLTSPSLRLTSEPRWNSTLQRDEIVREHTRRWEGELSIRQPVILFGFPTNGYLSFNNRMYRYNQIDDDGQNDVSYYNRYYISYSQPLFQPNSLKNSLEQAELRLEGTQLRFVGDVVDIVSSVADGYHSLLEQFYTRDIDRKLVSDLDRALGIAVGLTAADSSRQVDVDQIQVELSNAREELQGAESSIRFFLSFLKRELGLDPADSVSFEPTFELDPVPVDIDQAATFAMGLTPSMRQLDIDLRNQEIRLDRTRSRGAFRMNLRFSYGRERRDEFFDNIWVDPDNSYTIDVTAYLPIWDWGERKARIQASEIGLEQTRLRREQTELRIISDVRNEVLNVWDREERTRSMEGNLELAKEVSATSFQRYEEGAITAQELLLNIRRERVTAENFVDAYVGWKGALARLQRQTFFSFERGQPVLEWFQAEGWVPDGGFDVR